MNVLIVEDDDRTASFVEKGLRQAGFVVSRAETGPKGLRMALGDRFDVLVVDVMLPGCDGTSVVRELRAARSAVPVIMLSAKDAVQDRVRGLEAGADDYLVKPFSFTELLARIHALLRRSAGASEATRLRHGDLEVDLLTRKVTRGGDSIELQPREFGLLEYLLRNAGRVVSKTMIMEHVWSYDFDPRTNVVEARICKLRDKIDRGRDEKMIHTVRGVGYVLESR